MIRTTAAPRIPVRVGAAAAVGMAGAFALAACAPSRTGAQTPSPASTAGAGPTEAGSGPTGGPADAGASGYADGTYTAEGSYATPETVETISVTVTLQGGVITDVKVKGDPKRPESVQYQGQFIGGIADVVEGKSIDGIQVSRVAGSSLTSGGFNEAIDAIKAEAAA